jgi:hypothetical protein
MIAQVYMLTNSLKKNRTVVEQYVDYICEQGCEKVSGYIEAIRNNHDLPELSHLSDEERIAVHDELVSIMSVYEGKCSR